MSSQQVKKVKHTYARSARERGEVWASQAKAEPSQAEQKAAHLVCSAALLTSPIASRRRCNATPPHRLHGRHRLHGGGSEGTGLELLRVCQDVGRALGRACVLARWPPRRLGPEEGPGELACMAECGRVRRSNSRSNSVMGSFWVMSGAYDACKRPTVVR